jgi:hypothetical protein
MASWEEQFGTWAKGPSATEQAKCENAESVVRTAIRGNANLKTLDIKIFTQGSYAARTNVRLDSDVDICVCRQNLFYYELPPAGSKDLSDYGIVPASISFGDYKNSVGDALTTHLGNAGVKRGDKVFDVHANTYRVDADVVPAFEYRRYTGFDSLGRPKYRQGIEIIPDSGDPIINWPQQTYDNGVAKNDRTNRMYKRIIRILKRLRNAMQDDGVREVENVASFLIECLVWNTPDNVLVADTYFQAVRGSLVHLYNASTKQETCNEWGEVNELKYLFRDGVQPWTRDQANKFVVAVWQYVGFK